MEQHEPVIFRVDADRKYTRQVDVSPIVTEIIRNSLNSVAKQMKQALVRTAYSPIIYDVLDFAAAIYDRHIRMLAQADSLPAFMGTLNFCVKEAVEAIGGSDALEPGDILLYNVPYGTGSHPQDAAIVMPAFFEDELVGYAAIKAHWMDIGALAPSPVGTTDVYQEGTMFPGVKLYQRGKPVRDIYRTVLANTRHPKAVSGDIHAQVVAARTAASGLQRIISRYGLDVFQVAVEQIFEHGEAVVRNYFEKIPDGRYVGSGRMDNDALSDEPVDYQIFVEVRGSSVRIDFSGAPDTNEGPANCPLPSTVSASRVAILMLAGGDLEPNDGHFRALDIVTRPGSMFHPLPPSPCYHFGTPCGQIVEAVFNAFAKVRPELSRSRSADDLCAVVWWGTRGSSGEFWSYGSPHPTGQGACVNSDGYTAMHAAEAATRFTPAEVIEAKYPILVEKAELATDSCGAGRQRSGLGVDFFFRMLDAARVTIHFATSKTLPWALEGGRPGRNNGALVRRADGRAEQHNSSGGLQLYTGDTVELYCGGGGGYGVPDQRDIEAVENDLSEGYISPDFVRENYPQAVKLLQASREA